MVTGKKEIATSKWRRFSRRLARRTGSWLLSIGSRASWECSRMKCQGSLRNGAPLCWHSAESVKHTTSGNQTSGQVGNKRRSMSRMKWSMFGYVNMSWHILSNQSVDYCVVADYGLRPMRYFISRWSHFSIDLLHLSKFSMIYLFLQSIAQARKVYSIWSMMIELIHLLNLIFFSPPHLIRTLRVEMDGRDIGGAPGWWNWWPFHKRCHRIAVSFSDG